MDNRFLSSFFFVLFLASTLNIYCAQPHTKQQNTTDSSYKIVSILPQAENSNIEYNPNNMVLKIHNDNFLLIDGNDTSDARTFSIQKNELDEMISAASKAQRSQCYVHIKQKNTDFYFKIPKATLEDANRKEPALGTTPTKTVPQSKSKKPQKILPLELDLPPIDPKNFRLPYPDIKKNSDMTALRNEDTVEPLEEVEKQFKVKLEEAKNKKLAKILKGQKQANLNSQNQLNLYYQKTYLEKMEESVKFMQDVFPEALVDDNQRLSINQRLKNINSQKTLEISDEEYKKALFDDRMAKLASWDIEQFNRYNKSLEENGQPPVSYKYFHNNICSSAVRHKNDTGPEMKRFEGMRISAKEQLKKIRQIEEQTKQIEKMTEMKSPQNYAKAIMISRGAKIVVGSALEEALLFSALSLASLIPDMETEKTIASLEKENGKLDKIFDQKKTHFNLLSDEGLVKSKKIALLHEKQIRANKQIADKLKKRPREQQIKDIQEDLNKQRTKYVSTK